jgi:hypothetical protein
MAKKKTIKSADLVQPAGQPKAPHNVKLAKPGKDGAIYEMTKWKGLDNYQCLFCNFASLHRERIFEHYTTRHTSKPKAPAKIIDTGLVTEDGQPIGRVEEPAMEE